MTKGRPCRAVTETEHGYITHYCKFVIRAEANRNEAVRLGMVKVAQEIEGTISRHLTGSTNGTWVGYPIPEVEPSPTY